MSVRPNRSSAPIPLNVMATKTALVIGKANADLFHYLSRITDAVHM